MNLFHGQVKLNALKGVASRKGTFLVILRPLIRPQGELTGHFPAGWMPLLPAGTQGRGASLAQEKAHPGLNQGGLFYMKPVDEVTVCQRPTE